ncbi:hypothetical protein HZC35_03870 [Candidatus Saganbacteria bacterium]|nr:hypothetical protein [Candidatus Saganbacteria bacterium]
MKKTLFHLVIAVLLFSSLTGLAQAAVTHPTREEWLEVWLTHKIQKMVDPMEPRVTFLVNVLSSTKEIIITYMPAQGGRFTDPESVGGIIRIPAEKTLKDYPWARNYQLTIKYIEPF